MVESRFRVGVSSDVDHMAWPFTAPFSSLALSCAFQNFLPKGFIYRDTLNLDEGLSHEIGLNRSGNDSPISQVMSETLLMQTNQRLLPNAIFSGKPVR